MYDLGHACHLHYSNCKIVGNRQNNSSGWPDHLGWLARMAGLAGYCLPLLKRSLGWPDQLDWLAWLVGLDDLAAGLALMS